LSEGAVNYAFEQLEPSAPPPRDAFARMLAQASAQAAEIREQARAEGYEAGHAAGREHGARETAAAAAALAEAARGLAALREETVAAVEGDALELAVALAGKVLAGALEARPELVVEVVQGALRRIVERRRITVIVNPDDVALVREAIGEIASQGSGIEVCEVISEERVGVGSAIVRTIEGEVDASVQTQLERARELVEAAIEDAGSPA